MQLVDYDPFATAELTRVVPSTAAQKEIWIASRMGADVSCAFNECVSLHLSGPLDSARFKRAFQRLIELHEILRCTFSPDDGRLCVAAQALIAYREGNLAESALPSILAAEVETPFDLENGPLVRGRLDRLFDNEYRFTLTAHHSVCDGWSLAVLLRDLGHCYAGTAPPEAQPFSEYMNWLESDEVAEQRHSALAYWIDRLKGDLPTLQLPTDRPHQPVRTFRANRLDHAISPETTRSLKRAAGRAGVSFFTFLFTAFAGFLHRLTGQQDLIIGVPAAGQSTSGLTNVVGHCVNLLPIRCAVDPRQPFGKCLSEARTAVLDAYDHQQLTYGELLPHLKLRRDASRPPLVSVAFNLEQAVKPSDLPFPGLEVSFHSNPRHF